MRFNTGWGAIALLALFSLSHSSRATVLWDQSSGGSFGNVANWAGGSIPSTQDIAEFDLMSGTVLLSQDRDIGGLAVGEAQTSLNLGSRTLTLHNTQGCCALNIGATGTPATISSELRIQNGAFDAPTGEDFGIGIANGSTPQVGAMTVADTASVNAGGDITLANSGTGTLTVKGTLRGDALDAGFDADALGTIFVSGAAGNLDVTDSMKLGGFFGGTGNMLIEKQATTNVGSLFTAENDDSSSGIIIDDATLTIEELGFIGQRGNGAIRVDGGGQLKVLDAPLFIGGFGDGYLEAGNGSTVEVGDLWLANSDGSDGDLLLSKAPNPSVLTPTLTVNGIMNGGQGEATLTMDSGSEATIGLARALNDGVTDRTFVWGFGDGHGEANISGTGTRLFVAGETILGDEGTSTEAPDLSDPPAIGEMLVTDGALVNFGTVQMGLNGARGILAIRDSHTLVTAASLTVGKVINKPAPGQGVDGQVTGEPGGTAEIFVNTGATLDITGALDVRPTGSATINVDGTLNATSITLGGGSIGGSGTVSAALSNTGGTVSPGNSPGIMTTSGDYRQGPEGTLLIELAGNEAGISHDQFQVLGTAFLDGYLQISLLGDFQPEIGSVFDFMLYETRSGTFENLATTGAAAGYQFSVGYDDTRGIATLSVDDFRIPGPGTLPLLGLALIAAALARRSGPKGR